MRKVVPVLALGTAIALAMMTVSASANTTATAPHNTVKPSITGTPQAGATLKADPGTWTGTLPISFTFQWQRCTGTGPNTTCVNIAHATDSIYTVSTSDVGTRLRVLVTASNTAGASTAFSAVTAFIKPAPPQAPKNTKEPFITGTAQQGQTLTANPGSWSGTTPITFNFQWRRCDTTGSNCVYTTTDTQTYVLGSDDVGHTLRVLVTAKNSGGNASALSNATSVVTTSGPPAGQCQAVSKISLPERLVIDKFSYNPPVITSHAAPFTAKFHVSSTRGYCVSGALVLGLGVPFNRLSVQPEVATDNTGWATITFSVRSGLQIRPGNLLVIFARARKPGENVLTGITASRLVSVHVG